MIPDRSASEIDWVAGSPLFGWPCAAPSAIPDLVAEGGVAEGISQASSRMIRLGAPVSRFSMRFEEIEEDGHQIALAHGHQPFTGLEGARCRDRRSRHEKLTHRTVDGVGVGARP